MEEVKLSITEFFILKQILLNEGHTLLIKDIAAATHLTYQTVSRHVNKFVNQGDIQREGKKFTIVNPYFREAVANG